MVHNTVLELIKVAGHPDVSVTGLKPSKAPEDIPWTHREGAAGVIESQGGEMPALLKAEKRLGGLRSHYPTGIL